MRLLEWSDTQLTFHITETEDWTTTNLDLTQFDKVLLVMKFSNETLEIEWTVDSENNYLVRFDIYSEQTKGKAGSVFVDVWWIEWTTRLRLNRETIQWNILSSVKVPEWIVNG